MGFGQIIKRAWEITWRYRYLWILGLLAGVTGAGGGGGGGGGSNSGSSSGSSSSPFNSDSLRNFTIHAEKLIPYLLFALLIGLVIVLALLILSVAARGGLAWAVNEIEEGRRPGLGQGFSAGFHRFWRILGFGIVLAIPMLFALVVLLFAVIAPIVIASSGGRQPGAAIALPVCGSLLIGIPLLIVLSFVIESIYVLGIRRIMIEGDGVGGAIGSGWHMVRSNLGNVILLWLINLGLNIVAGLVVFVPIVLVSVVLGAGGIFAGQSHRWGLLAVVIAFWVLVVLAVALLFGGIWGTFTSAFWTLAYRRMTGRQPVLPTMPGYIPPIGASVGPGVAVPPHAPGAWPYQPEPGVWQPPAPVAPEPGVWQPPAPVAPEPPMAPPPPAPAAPEPPMAPQPPAPPAPPEAMPPHA